MAKVESCSGREAEYRLAQHFPDAVAPTEKIRVASEDQISVQVTFTREQFEKLKRIQELLSHTHINASNAALLDAAMDALLDKKDPLKKTVRPSRPTEETASQCDTNAEVVLKMGVDSNSDQAAPRSKRPSTLRFDMRSSKNLVASANIEIQRPDTAAKVDIC